MLKVHKEKTYTGDLVVGGGVGRNFAGVYTLSPNFLERDMFTDRGGEFKNRGYL